ncbi:hypothetical protein JX266_010590 [Neoarthrinium moseri]|nr:hypothetical protein JX266_010590 [Neoarthrinium moseri]
MSHIFEMPFSALWIVLALLWIPIQAADCERACLEGLMSGYLNALAANNHSGFAVTSNIKYVENGQILRLGSGIWPLASSLGTYRHVFSDPDSGQVAAITTMSENGVPVIYVVRLKREMSGLVSEIESAITRDAVGAARYDNMTQPESVWLDPVPPVQRIPRADLVSQTNKYYTGMERNDPKGDYSFFDEDCNHLEDGLQTTNMKSGDPYGHSNDTVFASLGCQAQFQTGFLGFVTQIRNRRFSVVDEERQTVVAFTTVDHNGTVRSLPEVNGTSSPIPPYFAVPRSLAAVEAFRFKADKLYRIEMTLVEVPYGMASVFPEGKVADTSGKGTNSSVTNPCNASCLNSVTERVLHAMASNDTVSLPLENGVRYAENGQFLALGDGLWETLGHFAKPGVDDYAVYLADPESQTAAYWGVTREHNTTGVLALRIKFDHGKITEIEAIDVRTESTGSRGGTMTLMRPPLPVEWLEGETTGPLDATFSSESNNTSVDARILMSAYFDGLERHSSAGVPFSAHCLRRDNFATQQNVSCAAQMKDYGAAPNGLFNGTSAVRDRRVLTVDAQKGVLAVAMVDNLATESGQASAVQERVPGTYMTPQLIKIENGAISRIEGMVKWMPLGYSSVWAADRGRSETESPATKTLERI